MKKTFIITLLFVLAANAVAGQKRRLTLGQCIQLALEQNYSLRAADRSVERARTLQGTAWDVERTELSLSQDPTSGGSPDNALALSQAIDFPTVYVARRRQLKAETQAERSRRDMVCNTLAADVASAYLQLAYEQECVRILAAQDSVLVRYRQIAGKRLEAGDTRRLEVMAADRLLRENRFEMTSAQNRTEEAALRLAQLLGEDGGIMAADTLLPCLDLVLPEYNYDLSPEGTYAGDLRTVADKAVGVARSGYAPTLSLSLRHQLVISSWNPYAQDRSRFSGGNFMGFEVGVGIPLFYGATRAKVKAAKMEREMADLQMRSQRQTREKEYAACLSRCNAAFARVEYYRGEGGQQAREMARLGAVEYENGEIGYVEYVSVLQESLNMRMKSAAAVNDYNQSIVSLQRLAGRADSLSRMLPAL